MKINKIVLAALLGLIVSPKAFCVVSARMNRVAMGSGGATNGNIMIESKDPKGAYADVLKVCQELNATVSSYNTYVNQQSGKVQISAQIQLAKDQAAEFMAKIALLGDVKSQNLSRNYGYGQGPDQLKKQMDDLDKEIRQIANGHFPILMGYAMQQRQNLESQYQQIQSTQDLANISISIQEPNTERAAPVSVQPSPVSGSWLSAFVLVIAAFAGGFLLAKPKANS